ncbi:heavy-metal-associated domain-containing protein [Paucibacter sp. R3-3]|uniref:Heavy-metal-associated domain-containing protein n=1 Tax=Roseateles agri TaxID=3098619 RepID=A0ABU5DGP8_9BURK|nr:heavy-metal-associated domain-containing protein [Paucibacter sp. R3-3]MDY0745461.1 heavy-metal-associated domain-containing protein [Paucibacter sp. R3-3]
MTIAFEIQDMSCGHCVRAITEAVKALDPAAQVAVDLGTKRVQIETAAAQPDAVGDAIREAGYTPVPA